MTHSSDDRAVGLIVPEDEDTIELELSEEQMQALSRAGTVEQLSDRPAELANIPSSNARRRNPRSRATPLLGIAVASGLLSGFAYLAITRKTPVHVAQAPTPVAQEMTPGSPASEESPPLVTSEPVRFRNPFDAGEVFEFPPGTSKAEARDAVAELLLRRALDRQQRSSR